MNLRFTEAAETQLEEIGDYIAQDNPERAITFIQDMRERCRSLSAFPSRFPLVERFEQNGIRKFAHGNYLIFFRIEGTTVVIVHVLHAARDYTAILSSRE